MKYSINGTGNIVAERDIYSLGGFIPQGTVGGKIASEEQLSQDGECWLAGGDISTRPDIVIKDNAYVGTFTPGVNPVHTDGVTEFSGNTLIPGNISIRCFTTDPKNNVFIKDSFIGVSMDVLCGPATTTTAFPFEQGWYNQTASKGALFSAMKAPSDGIVRTTATIRPGEDTYLYTPAGYTARILWAYYDTSNQLAYAGESEAASAQLYKLSHPIYRVCMVNIARGNALTPEQLGNSGAKILGLINGSLFMDLRPESASGQYVMDKSSFLMNTDNFGLATTQLRRLAGSMYDTNMYTPGGSTNYKVYGTFHNVQRLEYTMPLGDAHKTNVNRDRYISAYDCPLLRVDNTTYDASLAAKGNLTLRRCIVPKAEFLNDIINGNTFEDIDFSYANEDLGFTMAGYARFVSSHKQGIYRLGGGPVPAGFASHKGNLADTARLFQAEIYLPLDGNIIEQGAYGAGGVGSYYEASKSDSPIRIRTGKPLATFGLVFPSLPAGYSVKAFYYLDEDFVIRSTSTDPTGIVTTYPYVVMLFRKDDDSAINVTDFIALNITLRIIDSTKVPEITGSAYVGAGCTVRGDVQLHGDPYVNRLLDVNMWERGTASQSVGKSWEDFKISTTLGNRFRLMDTFPVEPGGLITCNSGYWVECDFFDSNGIFISSPGWGRASNYAPAGTAYAGIVIKKDTSASEPGGLIEDSDIPLANVKYVRAFKKRRYIVNELDRTSPEDILLGPDFFEQGNLALTAGGYYELAKRGGVNRLLFKRLLNAGRESTSTGNSTYVITKYAFDAITRFIAGGENLENRALAGNIIRKEPESAITSDGISFTRMVIEFTPSPRIIVPYGSANMFISGPKIRMYDNAVLSRNLNQEGEIVLSGDAVMGYDFNSGSCMCSNGHSDAIIKLP